jgi:hypothetical protein
MKRRVQQILSVAMAVVFMALTAAHGNLIYVKKPKPQRVHVACAGRSC